MIKFTGRARKVLNLAYYEAKYRHHDAMTCYDILLGMLDEGQGIGVRVLHDAGITLEQTLQHLRLAPIERTLATPKQHFWRRWSGWLGLHSEHHDWDALGLSPDAKRCLERAAIAAQRLGHSYIGTEHVLLGLLESGNMPVTTLLHRYNMDTQRVEQDIRLQLAKQQR